MNGATTPLVSVVIPNYNHRLFLPERFRSIFAQTYRHLEIIFLDDASTDGSVAYVRGLRCNIPLRIFLRATNSGSPFQQWSRGVDEARGEYLWIAESDDTCDPKLIERLVVAAERNPTAGIIYAQSRIIDSKGRQIESFLRYTDDIDPIRWRSDYFNSGRHEAANYLVIRNTIPNVSGCLFRRAALEEALREPVRLQLCGDWLVYARICERHDIAFVAEHLNYYRRHADAVRAKVGQGRGLAEAYAVLGYIKDHFTLSAENHETACRRHFAELLHQIKLHIGGHGFVDDQGLMPIAERFDPFLRLRLMSASRQRTASLEVSGRRKKWASRLRRRLSFREGEWTKVQAGPFCESVVLIPLGRSGLVKIRGIRFIGQSSAKGLGEIGLVSDYRQIPLTGQAHRIASGTELEIFSWGARPLVHMKPPEEILGAPEFDIELEVRATSRRDLIQGRSATGSVKAFEQPQAPGRRALFILPSLELGGADRVNLDTIAQLTQRHGWKVTVITTRESDDPWTASFLALSPDVFRLHRFLHWSDYTEFIEHAIDSRQPDVVFLSHSLLGYRLLPWLKALFPRLPVVDLLHLVSEGWKAGGYPRISVDNQAWLDRTIATSAHLRDWLIAHGREKTKVTLCYTNVDTKRWFRAVPETNAARTRWDLEPGRPILLFAARFCEQKQPRLLPAIVDGLVANGNDFLLLLAGDGPDRDWLAENLCGRYPLHSRMLGPLPHDDIRQLMSAADILLLPSREEGIALVLYEAMSMGVVPVATDVGGQREIVTPECGVLVENGPALVETMTKEIENLLRDPAIRERMARSGRIRIEQMHSLDRMGDQMNELLVEATENRQAALSSRSFTRHEQATQYAAKAVKLTLSEELRADIWAEKMRQGRHLPRIISNLAAFARGIPVVGNWAMRVERHHGERLRRLITRWP